jgi:hypothetical protein
MQIYPFRSVSALYFDITTTEISALAEETPAYQPTQIFPLNIILYGPRVPAKHTIRSRMLWQLLKEKVLHR